MAGRVKADCGANLIEHSYALNGARLTLVAKRTAESSLIEPAEDDFANAFGLAPRKRTGVQ